MRRCGAAARTMLEAAAAERWKVPVSEVEAKNHEVVHRRTGRRAGYGSLAKAAASQRVPARETLRLKDPTKFRYIGKSQVKLVDGRDIATGKAQYGIDTRLDGMLYAVVARPPVYGGKVASFDPAEALKVPGVERVVQIEDSPPPAQFNPLGGVAVLARNTWAAMQGRRALKITWDDGPNASYDSSDFKTSLEESARKPGKVVRNDGDFDAAAAQAARRLDAEYYVPHLAHATMEPPAATVRITNGKCEVWGCFQSPQGTRDVVAKRLGMSADDVTVHVTLLGGGFGRKSKPDFAIEAAVLSKAVDGKPAKVTWTRRASRAPGCTGAWRRPSSPRSMLRRRTRHRSSSAWASSTCRSQFPTSASRTPRRSLIRASAGSDRSRTFPMRSRSSRSSPSWPRPPAGTRRAFCWRRPARPARRARRPWARPATAACPPTARPRRA